MTISVEELDASYEQLKEFDLLGLIVRCRNTIHELAVIGKRNTERAIKAEQQLAKVTAERDGWKKNAGFYACCARGGEVPTEGAEPYTPQEQGEQE
jgi:hypothetical protein